LLVVPGLSTAVQQPPIIVKLIEPEDSKGLVDVLIGALGLSGLLALVALIIGALVAGALFLARSRRPLR
jgi:hypothetical protein